MNDKIKLSARDARLQADMDSSLELFNEMDNLMSTALSDAIQIDESFNEIAGVFNDLSLDIFNSISSKDSNRDMAGKAAAAAGSFLVGSIIKGVGSLVRSARLAGKKRELLKQKQKLASEKLPFLQSLEVKMVRNFEIQSKIFGGFAECEYSIADLCQNPQIFNAKKKLMTQSLAMFKRTVFMSTLLSFLLAEYEAWLNGDHKNSKIGKPTRSGVSDFILNSFLYSMNAEGRETLKVSQQISQEVMNITNESSKISGRLLFMFIDEELLALHFSCMDYPDWLFESSAESIPSMKVMLYQNPAYKKIVDTTPLFEVVESEKKSGSVLSVINGLLVIVSVVISLFWFTNWNFYFNLVASLLLSGFTIYLVMRNIAAVEHQYSLKATKLQLYLKNSIKIMCGKSIRSDKFEILSSDFLRIIIGGLIGGVLGYFTPIPGGLFISSIIGAYMFNGYVCEEQESDGYDYNDVKVGGGALAWCLLFALVSWLGFLAIHNFL